MAEKKTAEKNGMSLNDIQRQKQSFKMCHCLHYNGLLV